MKNNLPGGRPALARLALLVLAIALPLGRGRCQESSPSLSVTAGLIRWWPDPFDAVDRITGAPGAILGVLPATDGANETQREFDRRGPILLLGPPITNQTFTFSFWLRPRTSWRWHLLALDSSEGQWTIQSGNPEDRLMVGDDVADEANWAEQVGLAQNEWQHLAVARRANGTTVIWRNGVRSLAGNRPQPWPRSNRWLAVGGLERGGQRFVGSIQDLAVFDREITDADAQALHAAGRVDAKPQGSTARLQARERSVPRVAMPEPQPGMARHWNHRRFTTEDGLPGNAVHALLQSRDGFLWVGTDGGLARFDGRKFQALTARTSPALATTGENIFCLSESPDGTIWAGAFGGLLRLRGLDAVVITNGLPQRFVVQVLARDDDSLWVAGFNHTLPRGACQLRLYEPNTGTTRAVISLPGQPRRVWGVADGLWLCTENPSQILFWDGRSAAPVLIASAHATPLDLQFANHPRLPPDTRLRTWNRGESHWAEVQLGAAGPRIPWLWDQDGVHVGRGQPSSTEADSWFGAAHQLAQARDRTLETALGSQRSSASEIECLLPSADGGAWFGTDEDGLHHVQAKLVRVLTEEDGVGGGDVVSVGAAPDGKVWFAAASGLGYSTLAQATSGWSGRYALVAPDGAGGAWFARRAQGRDVIGRIQRDAGVETMIVDGVQWTHPNTVRWDREGRLWWVCGQGVSRLDPRPPGIPPSPGPDGSILLQRHDVGFRRYEPGKELPSAPPCGLVEDPSGGVWVGSLGGGISRIEDGRITTFSMDQGLPHPVAVPVLRDAAGSIWIATPEGIARHAGARFEVLRPSGGWPEDTPLDALEDGLGYLWITGRRGIHRLAKAELEAYFAGRMPRVHCLTLGLRDGLLTPECSILHYPSMARTPDGMLWIATRNGLARIDPSQVRPNLQPPRSYLEQVQMNDGSLSWPARADAETPLRLPPGSGRGLEFHYGAINLPDGDRTRFRYRLDGYDADWRPPTDLRAAFYTNLRPGRYRFRLLAANSHQVWSEQESTLEFEILPRLHETVLFRSGLALGICAGGVWIHRRRLRNQRSRQAWRHRQDLMQEKARIAADMHDELGAALTRIAILGEVAQRQTPVSTPVAGTLNRISQAAREVAAAMSELVWVTNPRNDDLASLVAHLRERAAQQLQDTPLALHLDFPHPIPQRTVSATLRRNLLFVLKESLTNVIRHSRANRVEVQCRVTGENLSLAIRDNGRGLPERPEGNGLTNLRRRTEELGGRFNLSSAPDQGVSISVVLPLGPSSEHFTAAAPTPRRDS